MNRVTKKKLYVVSDRRMIFSICAIGLHTFAIHSFLLVDHQCTLQFTLNVNATISTDYSISNNFIIILFYCLHWSKRSHYSFVSFVTHSLACKKKCLHRLKPKHVIDRSSGDFYFKNVIFVHSC